MHGQLTLQGASGTPAAPASATLLKELLRQRHLKYETFCAAYERTAAQITADNVPPSRAQFYRWTSGQLKGGMPYPDACRVLESMFLPWTVAELFSPYQPYDPAAIPEWARESIAREHPETLPQHLYQVAEIEAAKRYTAAHPTPPPPPTDNPRDYLHILAIDAWQALSCHQPAPHLDPLFLVQEMTDVFGTGSAGTSPVEQLIDDWYDLARRAASTSTTSTTS
jgi:hypothetical protein